ncbi:f-box domain-containing protein [Gigaspora margarita]|uniref:F-box domain-containing protein n=1 Tax=Gigaspora margarita TaxID=4874 RepID=A0A8H4ET73_GIGMA|nr:f-box domain-containing protein [Gigaspora margarita]
MKKLPNECFFEIFNNFRTDFKCLFSCLLVNRQWCRFVIPILWSEPTNHCSDGRLIRIFLLGLNAKEQALLIPFQIILPNCPRPLFEYSSYTKSVGIHFPRAILKWFCDEGSIFCEKVDRKPLHAIKYSLVSMFLRTCENLKCLKLRYVGINNTIIEGLNMNNTITHLSFDDIYLHYKDITILMEIISKKNTLVDLSLSYNKLAFAKALTKNITLTSLNLRGNHFAFENINALKSFDIVTSWDKLDKYQYNICNELLTKNYNSINENGFLSRI